MKFVTVLQLPLAGLYFKSSQQIQYWDESGDYRSSSIERYQPYTMGIRPYSLPSYSTYIHNLSSDGHLFFTDLSSAGNWQSVRCFKDIN